MPIKVHIACHDDGHIIPRMYGWLRDSLGWSMGPYLNTGAKINYYAPYTMFGAYGSIGGYSMAWFTHKETANTAKMTVWKNAKNAISYPLVTSPIYQAELNAQLITPGIDQDHFKPVKKKAPGKGIVGIVGTYLPRKGPELAASLQGIDGVNEVLVVGDNWPSFATSRKLSYADMPSFYAGLDLFVCTSTEEGIPAPPLEALACGVPVLIPVGVGMLDLLPHEPGIYRYTAGDADEMKAQIELILNQTPKHSRSMLRDYVAPYTIAGWADSHQQIIESLHV